MSKVSLTDRNVVVLGGGISGLAAAHRLHELAPELRVTLLEASASPGGVLQTDHRDGFLVERSADTFITNVPWAVDLCRRVGLGEQLLGTEESRRRALVVCRGKLHSVPEGFLLLQPKRCWPVLASPILSLRGKLRLACEPMIPRRKETADESLAAFVSRRLGREAFDRLVQPLVGGIYTADPELLSMEATMSRFQELERKHGSLIRAAWKETSPGDKQGSGARYSMFVAPKDGMTSLVTALASRLPAQTLQLNCAAENIELDAAGSWRVQTSTGESISASAVIVALPAPAAGSLLQKVHSSLADELAGIPYAGASVVVFAVRKDQITQPLNGFGFVVPAVEGRRILAGSFASLKFPGRAPEDCLLVRVFVGGALQPALAELPHEELMTLVQEELEQLIGLRGAPLFGEVFRWRGKMPQYHVGHLQRLGRIEQLLSSLPGLSLAGNAYRGVGIPQCIHSGEQAAEATLNFLRAPDHSRESVAGNT